MDILIKELKNNMITDYIDFFDNSAHSDFPDLICYCCAFNSTREIDIQEIEEPYSKIKGQKNSEVLKSLYRKLAIKLIKENRLKGYMAYCDEKAIGWCNANKKSNYSRLVFKEVSFNDEEGKIISIPCIAISPEYRGKGIDIALIHRVCEDAKEHGYDAVEAYPTPCESPYASSCHNIRKESKYYKDPVSVFLEAGFAEVSRNEKYVTVKKILNS